MNENEVQINFIYEKTGEPLYTDEIITIPKKQYDFIVEEAKKQNIEVEEMLAIVLRKGLNLLLEKDRDNLENND